MKPSAKPAKAVRRKKRAVTVSVVVPIYNVAPYLKECLDSVAAQTFRDIEVVCIDDGSTDGSGDIADSYVEKDSRFKLVRQKNRGVSAARNKGISLAKGEYIYFIDSDDWMSADALEKLVSIANEMQLDQLMFGTEVVCDDDYTGEVAARNKAGKEIYYSVPKSVAGRLMSGVELASLLIDDGRFPVAPWSRLFRLAHLKENGLKFPVGLVHEDEYFAAVALVNAQRVLFIDDKLYHRRLRHGSITTSPDLSQQRMTSCFAVSKLLEDYAQTHFDDGSRERDVLLKRSASLGERALRMLNTIPLDSLPDKVRRQLANLHVALNEGNRFAQVGNVDISVIIPVFNAKPYLQECLMSVLKAPGLSHVEVICIDDGSIDGSLDILETLQKLDSRVKLIRQLHQGAGVARNAGLDVAAGEYIVFLDADDRIKSDDALLRAYEQAKRDGLDILLAASPSIAEDGQMLQPFAMLERKLVPQEPVFAPDALGAALFLVASPGPHGKLYRRAFLEAKRLRFPPLKRTEDFPLVQLALALSSKIGVFAQPFFERRLGVATSLESTKDETPLSFFEAEQWFREALRKRKLWSRFKAADYSAFVSHLAYALRTVKRYSSFRDIIAKYRQERQQWISWKDVDIQEWRASSLQLVKAIEQDMDEDGQIALFAKLREDAARAAEKEKASKDERIKTLAAQLEQKRQAVTKYDEWLAAEKTKVAKRDERITALKDQLEQKQQAVTKRDEWLAAEKAKVAKRDERVLALQAQLEERNRAIADRDKWLTAEKTKVAKRDERVQALQSQLAERNRAVADRDKLLAAEKAKVAKRDERLQAKIQTVLTKDARIRELLEQGVRYRQTIATNTAEIKRLANENIAVQRTLKECKKTVSAKDAKIAKLANDNALLLSTIKNVQSICFDKK